MNLDALGARRSVLAKRGPKCLTPRKRPMTTKSAPAIWFTMLALTAPNFENCTAQLSCLRLTKTQNGAGATEPTAPPLGFVIRRQMGIIDIDRWIP